ncbi:MAG: hypothetical protein U1E73_11455 [Planctomycetota bacterium]
MTEPDTSPPPPPAWSAWERVLFRYLFCHFALYALPQPFVRFFTTAQSLAKDAGLDLEAEPWTWNAKVIAYAGRVDGWWQALTTWLDRHELLPFHVIHQQTGSGDTAHDWAQVSCIAAASLVLTLLWSLLPWPRGYPRLGRWLHLVARWWLAFWMLFYGGIKLYGNGQFGEPTLWMLTQELGDKSPMGMVWTFFGANEAYEAFGGVGEVLGALLLFHRRTALLGCCVTAAVMTNVAAINWLYDVPVKLFSTHLLLCAVLLLAPWRSRLMALFVRNTAFEPVDLRVVRSAWLAVPLCVFGTVWVAGALVATHRNGLASIDRFEARAKKPALFGMWAVETMTLDGVEVAANDPAHWNFLAFDRGMFAFVRTPGGMGDGFDVTAEDVAAGTITLKPRGAAAGEPFSWSFATGVKTVEEPDPEPKTPKDFAQKVAVERRTLVVRGQYKGKALELHAHEKLLRIHRGFHFVQELPYNR